MAIPDLRETFIGLHRLTSPAPSPAAETVIRIIDDALDRLRATG